MMEDSTDDGMSLAHGAVEAELGELGEMLNAIMDLNGKYGSWAVEQIFDACEEICRRAVLDSELPWNQARVRRAAFHVIDGGGATRHGEGAAHA